MTSKHILFIVSNNALPEDPRVWPEAIIAKQSGFEVSTISPNQRGGEKYQVLNDIRIYRYDETRKNIGLKSYASVFFNALFREFILSLKIYKNNPFQVIHAANPPDHIFIIALFYKLLGVKFIFDHHDLSPELFLTKFSNSKNFFYWILLLLEKFSCKLADVIITTNMSYKRIIINRHKINSEKVFVVRNNPSLTDYSPEKNKKVASEDTRKKLLFVGGINSQDGVEILLQALHCLVYNLNETDVICNIVGDGDSLAAAKKLSAKLDLDDFVIFEGLVAREKVKRFLSSADICLEPAPYNELNNHSTFIKVMEYMAAGKPIVACDLLETRYSTNNAAVLVKPGDVEEFAREIQRLIHDPLLRENLGKLAKERIRNELNWEKAGGNLKKAYTYLDIHGHRSCVIWARQI